MHRPGAGRFLDGGDPVHAGPGDPLVEGQNIAAVDLFDLSTPARCWPRSAGPSALAGAAAELTKEQEAFLDQAVAGLAQDGKVISVRLALFAEMVKGKPWTPATLKDVGGTEGVGVTFLEETFSCRDAPPRASPAPEGGPGRPEGTAARGRHRHQGPHAVGRRSCCDASGYADRPRDFDDLIRILDGELRLITPTDPEGRMKRAR